MRKNLFILSLLFIFGLTSYSQNRTTGNSDKTTRAVAGQNFHCTDIDGVVWDLFDLLDDGKYVLLEFDYDG